MRRLIIRPGGLGDCILSFPALESLCTGYTEVWVPGAVVPLVRFADRVASIAATGLDWLGLPEIEPPGELLERLASFDSVVSWYGANRAEFREAVRGFPFEFHAALPPPNYSGHAADFFFHQVGGSGPAIPKIPVEALPRDFIAIHPFSGAPRKNWPLACFRELAARLAVPCEFCAGSEEFLKEAVRFADTYDLARWLAGARAYAGNDSGVSHLAAAVGVPVVAVFGETDPAVWAPRGPTVRIAGEQRRWPDVNEVERLVLAAAAEKFGVC